MSQYQVVVFARRSARDVQVLCYVCRRVFPGPHEERCLCYLCAPFCCQECRGSLSMLDYKHKAPRRREAVLATREALPATLRRQTGRR